MSLVWDIFEILWGTQGNSRWQNDYMCLSYSRDKWIEDKNIGKAGIYVVAGLYLEAEEGYIQQEVGLA